MEQKGTNEQEEAKLVDANEEEPAAPAKDKKKRKSRQKKRKEELKSKATGVGLKISVDSAPSNNKKIVFDDSNLPSDNDDDNKNKNNNNDKDDDDDDKEQPNASKQAEDAISDDDDAVEEVKGTAARDKVLDQLKTEAEQSMKTKKKRKRKARPEKPKEKDGNNSNDEDMDESFFAQLDSARKAETKERIALEKSAAREAMKGKHTTFVFQRNKEEEGASDPLAINENIQVVVLNNNSNNNNTSTLISEKALLYSRNRLNDGKDPLEGPAELKRKRKRNGGEPQPWKRAKKGLATMGRSRLKMGKPASFFKRKRR